MGTHDTGQDRPRQYLRARRLAQKYDVHVSTIWRWVKEGRITPVRLGPNVVGFDVDATEAALRARDRA